MSRNSKMATIHDSGGKVGGVSDVNGGHSGGTVDSGGDCIQ